MTNTSFNRLKKEKRERIIEGAIKEFAEHGFDGASTNRIVKEVGIAKGSLFNYFNSKDALYLYAADYALSHIIPIIKLRMQDMPSDILERLLLMTESMLDIYIDNPVYYRFFTGILDPGAFHLREALLKRNEQLIGFMDFFSNTDTSQFRKDPESTFILIKWLFVGIKQEIFGFSGIQKDPLLLRKEFLDRVERVLDTLKNGIFF